MNKMYLLYSMDEFRPINRSNLKKEKIYEEISDGERINSKVNIDRDKDE